MARPVVLTLSLAAASANNIALSQVPVSGTQLTLNGAAATGGVATLDNQRRVSLAFGNEGSNRTMVISGTNQAGASISETLAVASGAGGTIATNQDFFTVTSALPLGGGWTAAVTLGTNGVGSSPWFVPNAAMTVQNIGVECELVSGAATFSVETTQNDVKMPIPIYQPGYSQALPVPTPFAWPGLDNQNGPCQATINATVAGIRLTILAGAGTVRATILQAGIRD